MTENELGGLLHPPSSINVNDDGVSTDLADDLTKAAEIRLKAFAPNTWATYRYGWQDFCRYSLKRGLNPLDLPAGTSAVHLILAWLGARDADLKASSLQTYLSGVLYAYRAAGFDIDRKHEGIRELMLGLVRDGRCEGSRRGPARAISIEELRHLVRSAGVNTAKSARNRALLLIGFSGAFRRSELRFLRREHVVPHPSGKGITVFLPRSKTDKLGKGAYVAIARSPDPELCPARAWDTWLSFRPDTHSAAFVAVTRYGNVRLPQSSTGVMAASSINDIVDTLAAASGIVDAERVSPHSLRAGFITSAIAQGQLSVEQVMLHVRHTDPRTTWGYVRDVEAWNQNVVGDFWSATL